MDDTDIQFETLYDAALRATDDVLGDGTYADLHVNSPDPGIRAAVERYWRRRSA